MLRTAAIVWLAILGLGLSPGMAGEAAPSRFYIVRVQWNETDGNSNGTGKVLAAPVIAIAEHREANLRVGSEVVIDDERIPQGTSVDVRVVSAGGQKVTIKGMIECSTVVQPSKELVLRNSTAAHFKRTITLKQTARIDLPTSNGRQWIDVTVEDAPEFDAAVRPGDRVRQTAVR